MAIIWSMREKKEGRERRVKKAKQEGEMKKQKTSLEGGLSPTKLDSHSLV